MPFLSPSCSSPYSRKYAVTVLSSSFGPWLSLLLFRRLGNTWNEADCRAVLLCGVALMALPLALMLLFDDSRALRQHGQQQAERPEEPDGSCCDGGAAAAVASGYEQLPAEPPSSVEAAGAAPADTPGDASPGCAATAAAPSAADSPLSLVEEGGHPAADEAGPPCCGLPAGVAVTLLITTSDFIGALASGERLFWFWVGGMRLLVVQVAP